MRVVTFLAVAALAGCSPTTDNAGPMTPEDFPGVRCTVTFREDVTISPSVEEVPLLPGESRTLEYADVVVALVYDFGEGEGGSLRVETAPPGGSVLSRDLYQFVPGDPPKRDHFWGGHGFTGLNYIYPPGTTAEAQFFCQVDDEQNG